jgi:hypothetical protein
MSSFLVFFNESFILLKKFNTTNTPKKIGKINKIRKKQKKIFFNIY